MKESNPYRGQSDPSLGSLTPHQTLRCESLVVCHALITSSLTERWICTAAPPAARPGPAEARKAVRQERRRRVRRPSALGGRSGRQKGGTATDDTDGRDNGTLQALPPWTKQCLERVMGRYPLAGYPLFPLFCHYHVMIYCQRSSRQGYSLDAQWYTGCTNICTLESMVLTGDSRVLKTHSKETGIICTAMTTIHSEPWPATCTPPTLPSKLSCTMALS